MSLILRLYQEKLIADTREALRAYDSVLMQLPTGGGKTALGATMLGNAYKRGKRSLFIVHRQELVEQSSLAFHKEGIPHGFIAAGYPRKPMEPVQICSIDTLKGRLNEAGEPSLVIWDECHHLAAQGWLKVKKHFSSAKTVGLSATPQRLDGAGLDDIFQHMVLGPSTKWLIQNDYLSDYKIYAPDIPDMGGVRTSAGDFNRSQNEHVMNNNEIIGNAVAHYKKLACGKKAIVFCVSLKHAAHVTEMFRQAGIWAVSIDGKMRKQDRQFIINEFRAGNIKVLVNVDIVGEGFDLPDVEVVIMLRPTKSLALYLQQVGRALRKSAGKEYAIILDHAGNAMRPEFGLPCDEREWKLEGRKKGVRGTYEKEEPREELKICPQCHNMHEPAPKCPECGFIYPITGRLPKEKDGELKEIDKAARKKQMRIEQGMAQDLESLKELERRRNYKKGWAEKVFKAKLEKQRKKEESNLQDNWLERFGAW